MDGVTDFIVAGPAGQTQAGPAGSFQAGPAGVAHVGEAGHVPIDTTPARVPISGAGHVPIDTTPARIPYAASQPGMHVDSDTSGSIPLRGGGGSSSGGGWSSGIGGSKSGGGGVDTWSSNIGGSGWSSGIGGGKSGGGTSGGGDTWSSGIGGSKSGGGGMDTWSSNIGGSRSGGGGVDTWSSNIGGGASGGGGVDTWSSNIGGGKSGGGGADTWSSNIGGASGGSGHFVPGGNVPIETAAGGQYIPGGNVPIDTAAGGHFVPGGNVPIDTSAGGTFIPGGSVPMTPKVGIDPNTPHARINPPRPGKVYPHEMTHFQGPRNVHVQNWPRDEWSHVVKSQAWEPRDTHSTWEPPKLKDFVLSTDVVDAGALMESTKTNVLDGMIQPRNVETHFDFSRVVHQDQSTRINNLDQSSLTLVDQSSVQTSFVENHFLDNSQATARTVLQDFSADRVVNTSLDVIHVNDADVVSVDNTNVSYTVANEPTYEFDMSRDVTLYFLMAPERSGGALVAANG